MSTGTAAASGPRLPVGSARVTAERARRPRSLILRWVVGYVLGFATLIVAVLLLVYSVTVAPQESAADARVASELQSLTRTLQGMNVSEMKAVVTERSQHGHTTTIYLLVTRSHDYVAGNVRRWPDLADGAEQGGIADDGELQEFVVPEPEGGATHVRGGAVELPSGHRLLVAHDVGELRRLVGTSLLAVLGLTLLAGVGGGVVLSRHLSARLADLSRNSRAILEGDLARRMPVSPRGDEFDAMAVSLNEMLDRIDDLMAGMRAVSESIAHDLRSPITRLRSRIEVALMSPPDAERSHEVLQSTLHDVDAVLGIFNALLTIAVAESGAPRERFVALDLCDVAREAVETYEPVAEQSGLRLTLDAPAPVPLNGEPHLLAQALVNLLDNAIKYVPAPGSVAVRVQDADGRASLLVADDGPGLPASFREHAFERFTRVEQSRSTPGSGLGLSLVRAVARLHGGDVVLADAQPGLVVGIEIPRA